MNLLRRWGIHSEFANKIGNYKWICKEVGEFIMNSRKKILNWKWIRWIHSELNSNGIVSDILVRYWIENEFAKKDIELKVDSRKEKVNSKLIHGRSSDFILKSWKR